MQRRVINPIPPDERRYIEPLICGDGKLVQTLLELGNKRNAAGTYKAYFESLGIEHVSIDWNGQDGALTLDLRRPITAHDIDMQRDHRGLAPLFCTAPAQFDMVTNIGTTEHVNNQAGVWENITRLCRVGGTLVSITPLPGGADWWWHGEYYAEPEFFEFLPGFAIEKSSIEREAPNRNVCVRLRKIKAAPFKMPPAHTMYRNTIRARAS